MTKAYESAVGGNRALDVSGVDRGRSLRLILADDQPEILTLLQIVLEPHYRIVASARDGLTLLAVARALYPNIVLTDIDMPLLNGIDAAKQLRETLPECRVIFHTSHCEPEVMAAAFAAGAAGYLIKGSSESLISAIRNVVHHVWHHDEELVLGRLPAACALSASHARDSSQPG